jgi:hypothetical protein
MANDDPINEFVRNAQRTMPGYVYELANYKHERVLSFVPIHAGDYISVRLSSGDFLQDKKVKLVRHFPSIASETQQVLVALIELTDG